METIKRKFSNLIRTVNLKREFALEDRSTQIANVFANCDWKTANRLAFISEQALIARELGVAKSTIDAQTFSTQNGVIANTETETLHYLRGYEAIERET